MMLKDPRAPLWEMGEIPVVIYTRVSNDKQEQRSCRDQDEDCRSDLDRYMQRTGEPLVVLASLSDPDVSASRYVKADRPDWMTLLAMIADGRVRVVAFWEMSRSTRNLKEWAEFADVAEDRGIHVFLKGRMYDCTDPHDLAYLTNLVVRGIEEVGEGRERINRTSRKLAEKGKPYGLPVFGTRSVYDEKTGVLLTRVPDETRWADKKLPEGQDEWKPGEKDYWTPADLVREATRRILGGESRWSVIRDWNAENIPSPRGGLWNLQSLTVILTSSSIMGKRTHKGTLIEEGGWEPVILEKDWRKMQEIFSRGKYRGLKKVRQADLKYYFASSLHCGVCGSLTVLQRSNRKKGFGCPPKAGVRSQCVSRNIERLDEAIEALVVAELSRPDIMARFEPRVDDAQMARDYADLVRLKGQLVEAEEAAQTPGPGRMPIATFTMIQTSIRQEMVEINERLQSASITAPEQVRAMVEAGPAAVLERWRSLTVERKRSLLWDVTDSIHILPVGRVGAKKLLPSQSVDIRFVGDPKFELLGG